MSEYLSKCCQFTGIPISSSNGSIFQEEFFCPSRWNSVTKIRPVSHGYFYPRKLWHISQHIFCLLFLYFLSEYFYKCCQFTWILMTRRNGSIFQDEIFLLFSEFLRWNSVTKIRPVSDSYCYPISAYFTNESLLYFLSEYLYKCCQFTMISRIPMNGLDKSIF